MSSIAIHALSALAVAASIGSAAAQELVVNSYGGPYEKIIRERIIKPFEKETGIRVLYDAVGSASQDYAKIKATGGNPGFDVVVMTASQSLEGCKDRLLEKFTAKNVPNLARLDPGVSAVAGPCGAVHEVQYLSLLWRTDHIPNPPTSWNLLASPEMKGKIILPTFENIMAAYLVEVLSVMNGGTLTAIDPGFAAMEKIAKNTMGFEQSSAILEKYIRKGQVWAMPYWSGRAQLLKDDNVPVDYTIPSEGTIPLIATLNVPTGAEHKEAAFKFVDFFLGRAGQEAWVAGYKVGSIRADIQVPDEIRAKQITSSADLKKLHLPDLSVVASKLPEWGDRWQRKIVPAAKSK